MNYICDLTKCGQQLCFRIFQTVCKCRGVEFIFVCHLEYLSPLIHVFLVTFRSGLYVVSRLSNYMDIWVPKRIEKETETSSVYIQEMRRWIFQLVDLVLHKDIHVTCGSLESLRNIIMSCRRLPQSISPLNKINSCGHLLDSLLVLLTPSTIIYAVICFANVTYHIWFDL